MHYGLVLVPLISAFLGWFAGWVAVRMLFRPYEPKKIAGFTVQGLFPKKKQEMAEKLGKLISNELLSFTEIEGKIADPANFRKIMPYVEGHVDQFLRVKLVEQMPMISMFIGDKTILEMKRVFTAELETLFPVIMKNYMESLKGDLHLETMITEKVAGFSSRDLERSLYPALRKEFRFVQVIGGVLGLTIGLLQVFISCIL